MDKQEYNEIIEALTDHRKGVSDSKREDYTKGSSDVLANFKSVAESTGVSPLKVWLVYANKHWDAICNYIKSEGQSESEPIKERFGDLLNYLELGWGLISEKSKDLSSYQVRQMVENSNKEYIKVWTYRHIDGITWVIATDDELELNKKYKIEKDRIKSGKIKVYDKWTPDSLYRYLVTELNNEKEQDVDEEVGGVIECNKFPGNCAFTQCTCSTGRSTGI